MSYKTSRAPMGSPVPLKEGEEHCPLCAGYGYLPVNREDPRGSLGYIRCCGTGKRERPGYALCPAEESKK